jgi:hypothetical protein
MRRFLEVNQPRNKLGIVANLLRDRHKMSNHYREPSMHGFYQVLVHLAKWFQRIKFLEIDQPETIITHGGHAF